MKVAEMCTEFTAEELYTTKFSTLNELIFDFLLDVQKKVNSNLVITHVLIVKPALPEKVMANYEKVASEKASLMAEIEAQARQLKQEETVARLAKIKVEAAAEQERIKAENEARMVTIREKFTPEYLNFEAIKAWGSMDRVYYGEKIPQVMINPFEKSVSFSQ